ncbi:MAG: hypothetical protein KGJ59_08800 [Bacteroidota bacterium]|nr:hypothetical protein [Bacteroidota bacterium]
MKYLPLLFLPAFLFLSCGEQEIVGIPPSQYELKQNYPNPFLDTTVVEYGVPDVSPSAAPYIRLIVYDRFKVKQAVLIDHGDHPAGWFKVTWNGRGVNGFKVQAGIYYIELQQVVFQGIFSPAEVYVVNRIAALKQ